MHSLNRKECRDVGKSTVHDAREITANVRNESAVIGIAGGLNQGVGKKDAYADCGLSNIPWRGFVFRTDDSRAPIPDSMVQAVRSNAKVHSGVGDYLIPFSFECGRETIEKEFREGESPSRNSFSSDR